MGFNLYVDEDDRRGIESWTIAENHTLYMKWHGRLKVAYQEVADMFIIPKPFLFYIVDMPPSSTIGEMVPCVYFHEPFQVDLESECMLVNTQFWKACGAKIPVHEMVLKLGKMITSDEERIGMLADWGLTKGLHCFGVYPII